MPKKVVLVLEDDRDIQTIYKDYLESRGAEVYQAWMIGEAKNFFASNAGNIHLMLLDGQLPDGDSPEFASQVMKDTRFKGVIVAASASDRMVQELRKVGCHHVFTKPTPTDKYFNLIEELLK